MLIFNVHRRKNFIDFNCITIYKVVLLSTGDNNSIIGWPWKWANWYNYAVTGGTRWRQFSSTTLTSARSKYQSPTASAIVCNMLKHNIRIMSWNSIYVYMCLCWNGRTGSPCFQQQENQEQTMHLAPFDRAHNMNLWTSHFDQTLRIVLMHPTFGS